MYWSKSFLDLRFAVVALLFSMASCKPEVQQSKNTYFDLTSYFAAETKKLANTNFKVIKTVSRNGDAETTVSGSLTIYKALEPDLKTREIMLKKENGKVVYLMVFNVVNNSLFQTKEKLTYYPDSLYLIQRNQHVRFLGINKYLIEGKLKKL